MSTEASKRTLKGKGEEKERERAWFFAHHPEYRRLREHHQRHIAKEKRRRDPEYDAYSAHTRNAAREREYRIALREYEQNRIEREEAKAEWRELRREIANHGGVKVPKRMREDYRDLPASVRSQHGFEIDNVAEQFGYDNGDEFTRYVKNTRDRAARAEAEKPARPKRPEFEKEPRRLFARHQDPAVRALLDEYRETKKMLQAGERELGKGHVALQDLYDLLAEQRRDYVDAARAAGERPAA